MYSFMRKVCGALSRSIDFLGIGVVLLHGGGVVHDEAQVRTR